jgi:NADH-quinone oxidoreductase subunit L
MPFAAWLIPIAPLLGMLLCIAIILLRRHKELAHIPAIAGLLIAAIASLVLLFSAAADGQAEVLEGFNWLDIGQVKVTISARLDGISLTLLAVVTGISLLVAVYSREYMHGDPGYDRFFATISAFVFCMVMLALANNLLVLYAFWEGVGLCSYLLIGFWYRRPSAANAALKAFLVNRVADCGLLIGILLLGHGIGSLDGVATNWQQRLDFDVIFQAIPALAEQHPTLLIAVGCLLLVGAIGKSAQFPLHVWLPDAMEGPTPVSALIHAATMVTAGIYLLARMSPLLAATPVVLLMAGWIGAITALLGGCVALFQYDLKRVLAYSTISQLGYMFLALGAGMNSAILPIAIVAAMFHLITHAFFKALLFLAAGNVMHAMGDVMDMRRFSGLQKILPTTHRLFLIGAVTLMALPPLSGFWSKEGILGLLLDQAIHGERRLLFGIWLGMGLLTAFLTATYISRAYFRTFLGPTRLPEQAGPHPHEAGRWMVWPMQVLALGSLTVGLMLHYTHGLEERILPIPFLDTVTEPSHSHLWLSVLSVALAVAGAVLGYRWTFNGSTERQVRGDDRSGAQVLATGEGVDRFYRWLIVEPLLRCANSVAIFDRDVLDRTVRRIALVPSRMGRIADRWQVGVVSSYALAMIIGLVLLVFLAYVSI